MQRALIFLLMLYKYSLGRFLGGQCRFVPSCSQYAVEVISKFGTIKGTYLAAKRILRCNPFGPKGFDPAPSEYSALKNKRRWGIDLPEANTKQQ